MAPTDLRTALTPLEVRPGAAADSDLPDPEDPAVAVWRDAGGRVCALADRRGDRRRLHLPGIATYEFDLGTSEVVARAGPRVSQALIFDQFYRTAVPLILQARGVEVLHASGVRTPRGVVALCALKETGKSTLACALHRRGAPLWADDAVVFTPGDSGVVAHAVPFRLRLRPASAAHFGRSAALGSPFATAAERAWTWQQAPTAAAFVLARDRGPAPIELRRLDSSAAFTALLEHAYCFTLDDAVRKEAMMRHYLAFVARVPVFALRYPTGLEHLEAILDAIESALAEGG